MLPHVLETDIRWKGDTLVSSKVLMRKVLTQALIEERRKVQALINPAPPTPPRKKDAYMTDDTQTGTPPALSYLLACVFALA